MKTELKTVQFDGCCWGVRYTALHRRRQDRRGCADPHFVAKAREYVVK